MATIKVVIILITGEGQCRYPLHYYNPWCGDQCFSVTIVNKIIEVDSEMAFKLANNVGLKALPNTVLSPIFGKVNYS